MDLLQYVEISKNGLFSSLRSRQECESLEPLKQRNCNLCTFTIVNVKLSKTFIKQTVFFKRMSYILTMNKQPKSTDITKYSIFLKI